MELYITDLDGTLLDNGAKLSHRSAALLNKAAAAGVCFTAATARTLATVRVILRELDLRLPVILMNGVLIYDISACKYVFSAFIGEHRIESIAALLESFGAEAFVYTVENDEMHTYYRRLKTQAMRDFYETRRKKYYKSFSRISDIREISADRIIYFTLIDTFETLSPVYKAVSQLDGLEITFYRDNYSDDLWYMEIFSQSASKKKAVEWLRKSLSADRVICFGDNLNDIPMFEAADHSVAVANAVRETINAADEVIGSNLEDAVAEYIFKQKGLT